MLDFVLMITKYYKFSTKYRNFPRFLTEKRHRSNPPPRQRPYDVSRGQYRRFPYMSVISSTIITTVITVFTRLDLKRFEISKNC